ncbi:MAG: hypothetical protein OEV06_06490 [Anaerolineae bacterium]|nr:hypothetical protein [Anaerolineae bacterium]
MIFRIVGDYFNKIQTDNKGKKAFIGREVLPHLTKFPFKDRIIEGAPIIICDGELQVEAILEFDKKSRNWYARFDRTKIRDLESPADGLEAFQDASAEERLAILKYESEVYLEGIEYFAKEFSAIKVKSLRKLPKLFPSLAKENLRSVKILREMVQALIK